MKATILSVSSLVLILTFLYYRKQQKIIQEEKYEEMKKPQINVVPESVTSQLIKQLEKISTKFEDKIAPKTKKFRILISSAERNRSKYSLATDYQLKLPEKIYGIENIKLIKATFPTSLLLINDNNNVLRLSGTYNNSSSFNYAITIPKGNYSAANLASSIKTLINAAASGDGASFDFDIDADTLVTTTTITSIPSPGTAATFSFENSDPYILGVLGISPTGAGTNAAALVGIGSINVSYPQNIALDLDNRAFDFNSLRIMKKDDDDIRTFACFNMPSGNGTTGGESSSGYGTFVLTKDQTNAHYTTYEGPIPSTEFIHVRLRQLLPNGTIVTPDFRGADHTLEFEIEARIDKISLTVSNEGNGD